MHYVNGREAKVGDHIVGRDPSGNPIAGFVVEAYSDTDRCNLQVVPFTATRYTATAGECLHVDDLPRHSRQ